MQVIDQINGSALFAQSAYSAAVATKDNLGRDITSTYLTSHQSLEGYATQDWVSEQGYVTGVDLSNYYTKNETSGADELANAFSQIGPGGDEEVNSFVYDNSAKIVDVDTTYQANSASYLTAHQDLSDYQTIAGMTAYQEVGDYYSASNPSGFISEIPDELTLTALSVEGEIGPGPGQGEKEGVIITQTGIKLYNEYQYSDVDIDYSYIEKLDYTIHVLTSNSANWNEVSAKQPSGDYYSASNPSGFITGVDLSPYYTTADANTLSSMLSGAIDYVSANAGDEFPASANEAITAYQNASGTYLTAHQIIPSAKWENASDVVQSNSATWGQGGGSVTSPLGTISVDGSNIEATNSAVGTIVTPSATTMLGENVWIYPWNSTVFDVTLPTSGSTLYFVLTETQMGATEIDVSGKDNDNNIVTTSIRVEAMPGTYTGDLGNIVSNLSAKANDYQWNFSQIYATTPETSASGVYELAWKEQVPTVPDNVFTGYNTYVSGRNSYSAYIKEDFVLIKSPTEIWNPTNYSLTGVYQKAKDIEDKLNNSKTIIGKDDSWQTGPLAYKRLNEKISAATGSYQMGSSIMFSFPRDFNANTYRVSAVLESTTTGAILYDNWDSIKYENGSAILVRTLTDPYLTDLDVTTGYGGWNITNASAYIATYSGYELADLAFKDDLTGAGGGVPQSAFDELKQSYDALSSLFATYSGQWLLPNEGV